jgi:hypothetical protein
MSRHLTSEESPDGIAGDVIQRSADVGTAAYMNDLNAKVGPEPRNNVIDHYDTGANEYGLLPTAQRWYQNGIRDADMKMGERF